MRIHLLDAGAVAADLSEDRLTEAGRAIYLALGWALYVIVGYSTLIYSNVSRGWPGLLEGLSVLAVSAWGFFYSYSSNGGKEGRDFVVRFTCLLVPAFIKAHLFVWSSYYVLGMGFRAAVPRLSFPSKESADLLLEVSAYLPVVMTYLAVVGTQLVLFTIVANNLKRMRSAPSNA